MLHIIGRLAAILGVLLLIIVICQAIGLALLRYNIGAYRAYWHGRANQPGEFLYVALGDSAAQGIGASQPQNGYVGRIADQIARQTGRPVRIVNLSVSGATIDDAIRTQLPQLEHLKPDLVTAEIGANDMRAYDRQAFATSFERFLQALPPGRSVVSDMPYFATLPGRERQAVDANRSIDRLTATYDIPRARLHDVTADNQQHPYQKLITFASDFFHPNDRGYELWRQAFQPVVDQLIRKH